MGGMSLFILWLPIQRYGSPTRGLTRPAAHDDELDLAHATARRLGACLGSVVPLTGDRGTRQMRVTGIAFTMESSTAPYDNG
jgi:hypothetical protein